MSNLKVAVRVRPMSAKELDRKSVSSLEINNGIISVTNIKVPEHHAGDSRERVRKFAFDYCYNEESSQDEIFTMVENEVSTALSCRYHACVLAYGQSSTGKTYTMMGLQDEPGLTPRLCENIFKYFQSAVTEDEIKDMRTSVSYLEIYNERVQDLLTNNGKSLKVREHPKKGPYVQGLTEHLVYDSGQLLSWLSTGNGNRRVAATSNNRRSSRSHSVFTITSTQLTGSSCRLHLVDLAGSERAHSAAPEHSTPRLKEGANINRSLVALGNVICALSDQSSKFSRNSRRRFVPYRDSVLTWLLKETLGGNSKTVMIATISPSSGCYSETVNTLRFGQRAKQIVNRPVVNEDAKEKLIRELRAEIVRLKDLLMLQNGITATPSSQSNNLKVEMTESSTTKEEIESADYCDDQPDLEEGLSSPILQQDHLLQLPVIEKEQIPNLEEVLLQIPVLEEKNQQQTVIVEEKLLQSVAREEKQLLQREQLSNNTVLQEEILVLENPVTLDESIQVPKENSLEELTYTKHIITTLTEENSHLALEEPDNIVTSVDESSTEAEEIKENLSQSQRSQVKTDTLIPVIDITSSIKPKITKPTRLNRTSSIELSKSNLGKRKDYGSHETLTSPNKATQFIRRLSRSNLTKSKDFGSHETLPSLNKASLFSRRLSIKNSNENLTNFGSEDTLTSPSSNVLFSRRLSKTSTENFGSNETLSPTLPKTVVFEKRPSSENLRKSVIFGSHETLTSVPNASLFNRRISTENLAKTTPVVPIPSTPSRSGSISESSDKSTPKHTPFTRTNHRRSQVVAAVTQRLYSQRKERSSDEIVPRPNLCSTSRMRLQELSQRALRASKRKVNSETQTEGISTLRYKEKATDVQDIEIALQEMKHVQVSAIAEVQSVGVSCHVENYYQNIKLTRTCACQTEELTKQHNVSFTKYLQNPPMSIQSHSQPIYTSSVNINVSHNYPWPKSDISDDSLEEFSPQNLQYSPPDLISNHNSLEHPHKPEDKLIQVSKVPETAQINNFPEKYFVNEYFATDSAELCVAETVITPLVAEMVQNISVPVVRAAEIRKVNDCSETCAVFSDRKVKPVIPVQTFESYRFMKPKVSSKKLKSIIKQPQDSSEESDSSILYHKRVRFSKQLRRKDTIDVLQNFMDEASNLMVKLKTVAKQVESSGESRRKPTLITSDSSESKTCYVQTYLPYHDSSAQTTSKIINMERSPDTPRLDVSTENKWEHILKTSCDKLEQCVRLAEHKSQQEERRKFQTFDTECLHKFPQPFSSDTDWKYVPNDFSSLETTHSASDYGSLPRREGLFRRNTYKHYSPKAYMKQLVAMRKQIVETSRNDLMEDCRLPEH